MKTKIFHNSRCAKSRKALSALSEAGFELEVVNYLQGELKFDDIKEILEKSKLSTREIMRSKEAIYKDKNLDKVVDDKMLIHEVLENPILLERPIVLNQHMAMIVRDDEAIQKAIKEMKS